MKKNIGPKISESAIKFMAENFRNPNAGATYVLESFPQQYRFALAEMRGWFSEGELSLILDVMNGTMLTPRIAGQHVRANVADGIALDRLDQKWEIDRDELLGKLDALTMFQRLAMEVWAAAFWEGVDGFNEGGAFKEYIAQLT